MMFALAALLATTPATPPADMFGPLFRKVGDWEVRRTANGGCMAASTFGTKLTLGILLFPNRRSGLVLGSTAWTYAPGSKLDSVFVLGPTEFSGVGTVVAEANGRSLSAVMPSDFLAAFRAAKRLVAYADEDEVDPDADPIETLTFTDNGPVVDALNACVGPMSDAASKAVAIAPHYLNKPAVIQADDYPKAALRAGAQGIVRYRVAVAADGRPIDCTILSSSGNAELDAQSCALIRRRARFEPARDGAGQAMAGTLEARVFWRLP